MYKEIGSEFWKIDDYILPYRQRKAQDTDNIKFFVSGRTALDYILQDIIRKYGVRTVWLPSYCCDSMIEPFVRKGFQIRFFDILWDRDRGLFVDNIHLKSGDILYWMQYFGFACSLADKIIESNAIIIHDRTHSYFLPYHKHENYSYASLRKWFYTAGLGQATIENDVFCDRQIDHIYLDYIKMRGYAEKLKRNYMSGENIEKTEFLDLYSKAEHLLDENYVGFSSDIDSRENFEFYDFDKMKKVRNKNAKTLTSYLKNLKYIDLLFPEVGELDVPLFVPVLVEPQIRDKLRSFLIRNNVYCPIHWPLTNFHKNISKQGKEIYRRELSLICDQRYGSDEMKKQAMLIRDFFMYYI